jgi:signal transduction histidine kinase
MMRVPMDSRAPATSTGSYARIIADRVETNRLELATEWLEGLNALLPVATNEVFPSATLLDHIPALIDSIARYLRAPVAEAIAASTTVIDKARELGLLRHSQKASVHQLLREYELLAETLETFVAAETARLELSPSPDECLDLMGRMNGAVRTLMRTTVDTFVAAYVETIETQTDQLRRFTTIASHELRSPIGTLVFAADLLKKASPSDLRLARLVDIVEANASRLRQLVATLQQVAKLDVDDTTPSEQVIEVRALAEDVARQLADMADARGVSIRIDAHLPTLVVDPARLELVLVNLISNALKYSDPAKPERFVELTLAGTSQSACTLLVRDNGLGIPDEAQSRIFQRHYRAHGDLDAALGNDGSGLGLAIVAECVDALDGAIRCESRVGEGTAIFLELPLRMIDEPAGLS